MAFLEVEGDPTREVEMRLLDGSPKLPSPAMNATFVACGLGAKPADFPRSVRGRIALVQRGDITFLEKAINAQKAGATACVIYNNRPGGFFGTLGDEKNTLTIPVVSISQEDGQLMLTVIEDRRRISSGSLRLNPEEVPQPNRLAEFSSRGPNRAGWIKPELTAPGVNINSTTITVAPRPGGGMPDPSGYVVASGTSMATPHVAGAVALMRQAHPSWTTLQIKAALVNTASFMVGQGEVMDQGAGAMNLPRANECRAVLTTADSPASPTHSFGRVSNQGSVVRVSKPLAIHPLSPDPDSSLFTLSVEFLGKPAGLSAELSVSSLGCEDGCVVSFTLTLVADGAVLQDGTYSGWVKAQTTWGTLRLPFFYEAVKVLTTPPEPGVDSYFATPGRRRTVGSLPIS